MITKEEIVQEGKNKKMATEQLTKEILIEKGFKQCYDPELHIDIWTLGLIYDTKIEQGKVFVRMTFTSPFCPYGPQLVDDLKSRIKELGAEAEVEITFEPPWEPSEELRMMIGM